MNKSYNDLHTEIELKKAQLRKSRRFSAEYHRLTTELYHLEKQLTSIGRKLA